MRNGLASFIASTLALVVLAVPAAAQDRTYTPDQLGLFADLLVRAASIETDRFENAKAAPTDKAAVAIHEEAEHELLRAIEASGLTTEEFNTMVVQVQTDIRLSMQVTDELERRGAIPSDFEGDDAMAEAVFGSGALLTRRALDGEAGF